MTNAETDYRQHYYLVKCEDVECGYIAKVNRAPIRADRLAIKHAQSMPYHRCVVLNLSTLAVFTSHRYEPLVPCQDPPF